MITFLSGPMTGLPDFNRAEFRRIEKELKKRYPHWVILNPAILPDGMEPSQYLNICAAMIHEADMVIALPGWPQSPGAKYEKQRASMNNKTLWAEAVRLWPELFTEGGKEK